MFPDTQLNTCTGTVLIPNEIWPDGISWSDCSPELTELIADEHDITHVSCFTINSRGHRKHPVNIARIAFEGQDLPDRVYIGGTFYKVKPYISPHVSAKTAGDSDIQQNTVDPLHVVLSMLHLGIQTVLQQYTSVQTASKNIMFNVYKFESEVAALHFKHGLTLKEAR